MLFHEYRGWQALFLSFGFDFGCVVAAQSGNAVKGEYAGAAIQESLLGACQFVFSGMGSPFFQGQVKVFGGLQELVAGILAEICCVGGFLDQVDFFVISFIFPKQ